MIATKIDPADTNKRLTPGGFEGNLLLFTNAWLKNLPSDTREGWASLQFFFRRTVLLLSIVLSFMRYWWDVMRLFTWIRHHLLEFSPLLAFSISFFLGHKISILRSPPFFPYQRYFNTYSLCLALLTFDGICMVHWSALPAIPLHPQIFYQVDEFQLSEQEHFQCCEKTNKRWSECI